MNLLASFLLTITLCSCSTATKNNQISVLPTDMGYLTYGPGGSSWIQFGYKNSNTSAISGIAIENFSPGLTPNCAVESYTYHIYGSIHNNELTINGEYMSTSALIQGNLSTTTFKIIHKDLILGGHHPLIFHETTLSQYIKIMKEEQSAWLKLLPSIKLRCFRTN